MPFINQSSNGSAMYVTDDSDVRRTALPHESAQPCVLRLLGVLQNL